MEKSVIQEVWVWAWELTASKRGQEVTPLPHSRRNINAVRREDGQLQKAPDLGVVPTAWRVRGEVGRPGGGFMPGTGLDAVRTRMCHKCVGGVREVGGETGPLRTSLLMQ